MTAAVSVKVVSNSSVGVIPAAFNLINVSVKSSIPNCVLVANLDIKLNASAPASALPVTDVNDVLEAYISTTAAASDSSSTNDIALTKIDRSAYAALPNKLQTGQPSQYYVDRQTTPTISLYLAPDATTYTTLKFYTINRIEDAGGFTNTADVAYRFLPCMCSGLAYYLSQKRAPDRIQLLKQLYEDELIRALNEDGSRTSVYISPQSYFPGGG